MDQASPIAGGDGAENPIALPISNEIHRAKGFASNVQLNQEARMQASQQVQSSPPEEDDISRHIHEVFDHDLGRLPQGVVESPWADLQDNTQGMKNKSRQETANSPDFRVAAMLKDPRTRRQLFVLKEILDRPKNLRD